MNKKRLFSYLWSGILGMIVLLITTACAGAVSGNEPALQKTTAAVETHPSQGEVREIEAAEASLITDDQGTTMVFNTSQLEPGHVYTAWWVVVNDPAACEDSPCTPQDVLGQADAVQSNVTYADGIIAEDDGQGEFAAHLPKGDLSDGWLSSNFTSPRTAEVHVVINDHGPVIPEMVSNMLNSYRGGCTTDSLPAAFPDTAKADGQPGPNTCQLVQDAIFQQ